MTNLSKDDVLKLAKLARLKLSEDESARYQKEFSEILSYVEQLSTVETDNLKPTYQVNGLSTITRDDVILDYGTTKENLLRNVHSVDKSQIKVKRMIG
jgi:aspartyl-tRNA(Asn)/glutamyl-tRNA(Gln) amidotransferase subunit C